VHLPCHSAVGDSQRCRNCVRGGRDRSTKGGGTAQKSTCGSTYGGTASRYVKARYGSTNEKHGKHDKWQKNEKNEQSTVKHRQLRAMGVSAVSRLITERNYALISWRWENKMVRERMKV